ncbi:outer membrane lipoprotein carrier protein LolA [uncultured Erythrobacter sp.]|uniref:LolA family protein n=1 Tax=uncultured Erythrobacter sp. TaxID=263913 RepID=UPI002605A09A|nr:outer membrane lipoprotein carrier protein LolA [uncultured Erythrobacter sp.]
MSISTLLRRSGMAFAAAGTLALGLSIGSADSRPFAMGPAPATAQTTAADLNRAVAALRGIATMRADFTQTDRAGNQARGVMTLKRPGKIRFDYGEDADLLVVSNGRSLYMIDYEVNQVERWPIRNSPLGALLDPERDVTQYGTLVQTSSPDVISIDVRDTDRPEFGRMNLIFVRSPNAPGGLQLTHWVALDAQNHRTTVRLTNHRYGINVPESTFRFRDPRRSSRRPR